MSTMARALAAAAAAAADAKPSLPTTRPTKGTAGSAAAASRPASAPLPIAEESDGNPYEVSSFKIVYTRPRNPLLPTVDRLMDLTVELGEVKGGFVAPNTPPHHSTSRSPESLEQQWLKLAAPKSKSPVPQRRTFRIRLADIHGAPHVFYTSALWAIDEQIREEVTHDSKVLAVYVVPDRSQISGSADQRKGNDKSLTLDIDVGHVAVVRTVASGERITDPSKRVDNRVHKWIRDESPVQPNGPPGTTPLLRGDLMDDYVDFLNRQPSRHVDAAISSAGVTEPGAVSLDYLVKEIKPWTLYAQVSNTGTKETSEWRERFGFIDNELTNRDDVLTLDYSTAGFVDSHDVQASYDFPISPSRRVRARIYGNYDQFTASDVGFRNQNFSGTQYDGAGEIALNFFQHRNLFLDLVAGARYEHVYSRSFNLATTTPTGISRGSADFGIPYAGLRLEQTSDINTLEGELMFVGRLTSASTPTMNNLRFNSDASAVVMQAVASDSFYLEPILFPVAFDQADTTLAHELYFAMRAQYAFDDRLIPSAEEVAGGLYSVRGYPESISVGDTVIAGTAEYRFHLPRALPAHKQVEAETEQQNPQGRPVPPSHPQGPFSQFNWTPPQAFARPDWDLILRGFIDAGHTINSHRLSYEHDDTLVGAGVGLEFDFKQFMSARVDWGVALTPIPGQVSAGDNRLSVVVTFTY